MKLLYIHQYFQTPQDHGGTRSYWISKELVKRGHDVTMLTTSNQIESSMERVSIEGIVVIYLKIPYTQNLSIFKRSVSFFNFMLKSSVIALKEKNVDLVIATSTPLTVGFPALLVKKIKKIPFLFEVRDLWPEVPIQMGGLNNKVLIKVATWFEKLIYVNAQHIVALSPGMQKGIVGRGISPQKVNMIPNMSKIDTFSSREKKTHLIDKLGLQPSTFKVVYFGAMGIANGMDYIVEGIKKLEGQKELEFIFIGGGSRESALKKNVRI